MSLKWLKIRLNPHLVPRSRMSRCTSGSVCIYDPMHNYLRTATTLPFFKGLVGSIAFNRWVRNRQTPWPLVRTRTIPTERLPLADEI
jgi:hypothetical protein